MEGKIQPEGERELDLNYAQEDPWRNRVNEERKVRYDELLRLALGWKAKRALDISCGEGDFASGLRSCVPAVEACDLSTVVLARAQKRFPDIRFFQGDFNQLKASDLAPYDLITWLDAIIFMIQGDVPKLLSAFKASGAKVLISSRITPMSSPIGHWADHDYASPSEFIALMRAHFPQARFVPVQVNFGLNPDSSLSSGQKAARFVLRGVTKILGYPTSLTIVQRLFQKPAWSGLIDPFIVHIAMMHG